MAIRIPGQQGTFGLEPYFLPGSADWIPGPSDSAERILGEGKAQTDGIADQQVVPTAAAVGDTAPIHSAHADIAAGVSDHLNRAVADTGDVNNLRADPLSPQFGAIDQTVDGVASSLGGVPGVNINLPAAPAVPNIDTSPWQRDEPKNV